MAWDGRDVLRDVLPRDPAQHVQRRCKLKAGEPGLRLRKSAFAEAAKSSVETFSAGRAGAHPYRPTPLFPFRVFSRVSRAPFLLLPAFRLRIPRWLDQFFVGSAARMWTNSEGQVKYFRCTFFGHTTPDRAGARPYRVQCRVARCDMGLPAHTSDPLSRVSRAPFLGNGSGSIELCYGKCWSHLANTSGLVRLEICLVSRTQ